MGLFSFGNGDKDFKPFTVICPKCGSEVITIDNPRVLSESRFCRVCHSRVRYIIQNGKLIKTQLLE